LTSYAWNELTTSAIKPSARYGQSSILYDGNMVISAGYGEVYENDAWVTPPKQIPTN
jgi:hypothetical protein